MLRELISRSPDLARLESEGYVLGLESGHLVVRHVPYVTANREVKYGALVSTLVLSGDRTVAPENHVIHFIGEYPCWADGRPMSEIAHAATTRALAPGLVINFSFSSRPSTGYRDYFEKMDTYATMISSQAQAVDPEVTAKTFLVEENTSDSVFNYMDTATTRAGIGFVTARLRAHKVAIVGLGGTGSYILDLLAKCPVSEIHLFDPDIFHQHNAFRSPGAPAKQELETPSRKVDYFSGIYSRMHKGVVPHPVALDETNGSQLDGFDFVFLCLDSGAARGPLVERLRRAGKPFIDVGMGIEHLDDQRSLVGLVRVSTVTDPQGAGLSRIPLSGTDADQAYRANIQIADLNCLNAALAVVRWKRYCGFYQDLEQDHFSAYAINCNQLESVGPSCEDE